MYCLGNICYLCLENDKLISNINSSESVHSGLVHSLENLPFDLAWLNSLRTILVCEECCVRLRETYQFLEKCGNNIAVLRGFVNSVTTSTVSNTESVAELLVRLKPTSKDANEVPCAAQPEHEAINTLQWRPNVSVISTEFVDFEESLIKAGIICKQEVDVMQDSTETVEEAEEVFVNLQDYFVKDEDIWKREVVDATEECPMDNNTTENVDNDPDSAISVNRNTHLTSTYCASPDHDSTPDTDNEADSEKSENSNEHLTDSDSDSSFKRKKSYECAVCKKSFNKKVRLIIHMRVHTGEKPYNCSRCEKCFSHRPNLVRHMRTHTGEKPFECSECKKCFSHSSYLVCHMRTHTGEKPYECSECKKCFTQNSDLVRHMRTHTGDKPYACSECKKCFADRSNLVSHMRTHTGEKPYECSECKKCFTASSNLVCHMRTHTGEKPYACSKCEQRFARQPHLVRHLRVHTGEKS